MHFLFYCLSFSWRKAGKRPHPKCWRCSFLPGSGGSGNSVIGFSWWHRLCAEDYVWSPGSWRWELHIYTPSTLPMCHELPFSICAWRQQRLSLRVIVRSRWVPGKMPGMSWNGIVVRYFIMLAAAAVTIAPP